MPYFIFKLVTTAGLILAVSEIAKRNSFIGAVIASFPLVSLLSMIWLYIDTGDAAKVAGFSTMVFWLILASLPFFVVLPFLLRKEVNFYLSLGVSVTMMIGLFVVTAVVLRRFAA